MRWKRFFRRHRLQSPPLELAEVHLFERLERRCLFNVETLLFYEPSPAAFAVASSLEEGVPLPDALHRLRRKYSRSDLRDCVQRLVQEGVLRPPREKRSPSRAAASESPPVRHLELMVTHGCNMRCHYCYGVDGRQGLPHLYGSRESSMPLDVARRGVEFLFEISGKAKRLSVVFFGGEPLLEFRLIRSLTEYIRRREKEVGKQVDLSLSTNGALLSSEVVAFLVAERIGCQISIDGPPEIHDAHRVFAGGQPSYQRILPGVQRLLQARPGRVQARVTLTRERVDIPRIVEHLLSLGFGSVHVEPAIGGFEETAVRADDIAAIQSQNEALARSLASHARNNRILNYSNLVRLIRQTRVIERRLDHHCGAGRGYLALAQDGSLYPCHRFVGMPEYRMGDVWSGLETGLRQRISEWVVDDRPVCRDCWARHLCGGGCWQHGVAVHHELGTPAWETSCQILRHQLECAMAVNSDLRIPDEVLLGEDATPVHSAPGPSRV